MNGTNKIYEKHLWYNIFITHYNYISLYTQPLICNEAEMPTSTREGFFVGLDCIHFTSVGLMNWPPHDKDTLVENTFVFLSFTFVLETTIRMSSDPTWGPKWLQGQNWNTLKLFWVFAKKKKEVGKKIFLVYQNFYRNFPVLSTISLPTCFPANFLLPFFLLVYKFLKPKSAFN